VQQAAHDHLQRAAMDRRQSLGDIARQVLDEPESEPD